MTDSDGLASGSRRLGAAICAVSMFITAVGGGFLLHAVGTSTMLSFGLGVMVGVGGITLGEWFVDRFEEDMGAPA